MVELKFTKEKNYTWFGLQGIKANWVVPWKQLSVFIWNKRSGYQYDTGTEGRNVKTPGRNIIGIRQSDTSLGLKGIKAHWDNPWKIEVYWNQEQNILLRLSTYTKVSNIKLPAQTPIG